jgi:hypothetical protein
MLLGYKFASFVTADDSPPSSLLEELGLSYFSSLVFSDFSFGSFFVSSLTGFSGLGSFFFLTIFPPGL